MSEESHILIYDSYGVFLRCLYSRNTELLLVGVITCLGSSLLWSSIAFSLDGSQRNSPHHFVGDGSEHGQQHIAHIKESGTKSK